MSKSGLASRRRARLEGYGQCATMRPGGAVSISALVISLVACGGGSSRGGAEAGASSPTTSTCAVVPPPDAGARAVDGGFWVNNPGGDEFNYDWTCGSDSYALRCSCDEFAKPPNPTCTCSQNGTVGHTVAWICGDTSPSLPTRCGYPTP